MYQGGAAFEYASFDWGLTLDGTKIEANANKYSFVWKKSTLRFEEKLKDKIQETLQHIHQLTQEEGVELGDIPEEATPTQLVEIAEKLEYQIDALTEEVDRTVDMPTRKTLRARQRLRSLSSRSRQILCRALKNIGSSTKSLAIAIVSPKPIRMPRSCE